MQSRCVLVMVVHALYSNGGAECRGQGLALVFVVEMVLAGAVVGCQGTRNREGEASIDWVAFGGAPCDSIFNIMHFGVTQRGFALK